MERHMKTSTLLRRFIPYFKKYWPVLAFDLFCAALTTLCELTLPLMVRYLTGVAADNISALTITLILRIGGLYLLLRIIDAAANYFMQNTGHVMGSHIETDMRRDLFEHLQRLSFAFFDTAKTGQIMARITSDLFDVTVFSHHCPEEYFIAAIKIIASFVILANTNLWLTLIIFSILPVMLVCSMAFNMRMRRAFKKSRVQIGEINSQVEDSLLGVRVVKSFANEDIEKEKFQQGNNAFLEIKREQYRYMAGFNSTVRIFDGIMYLAVLMAGSIFMMNGKIGAPDLMAYLLYVTTLLASIRRIIEFTEQFQRGMTGIERFYEVMDAPVDIEDAPGAKELGPVEGNIRFDDVSFHYPDDQCDVLSHIQLDVKAGESVALVGPSGSGKTTLCSLIPRFYDVTGGRILIDGSDVRELTLDSLRSQIGVVQQDVYLFAGTVFDNIAYGRPGASRAEVMEAAKMAGAHDFISQFPDRYDTFVGERGVRLSGGQKQRISIARVFLKNPPVLILDEATSALDNESERIVQQSLEKLAKGRTTFTIAHRLTTIRGAQHILVLTEEGIAEQGTHEELLAKGGIYSGLYKMYSEQ